MGESMTEAVGSISYQNSGWGLHFTQGKRLDSGLGDNPIVVSLESNHDTIPDYFEISAVPIVSENFVLALKTLPDDRYQLFPATIKMPSREIGGYHILNIVGRLDCIDIDASDTKMYDGSIMRLMKLVMRKDLSPSMSLFRANEYPLAIFISDKVAAALRDAGLSGMKIDPAPGWGDDHRF